MGMTTRNPYTNALVFDSDNVPFGMCLGVYTIPAGQTWSRSWPLLAGCTLRVTTLYATTATVGVSVSYPSSVPTVSAATYPYERVIVVFASGSPAATSGAGVMARTSSSGAVALSTKGRGLNYIGKAVHTATSPAVGTPSRTQMDGQYNRPPIVVVTITSVNRPVPVIKLGLHWQVAINAFASNGNGTWSMSMFSLDTGPASNATSWPNAVTPEVYCFAAPTDGGAVTVRDEQTGELSYNLTSSPLLSIAGQATWSANQIDTYRPIPAGIATGAVGAFGHTMFDWKTFTKPDSRWNNYDYIGALQLESGQILRRRMIRGMVRDDGGTTFLADPGATIEIINLAGF
jgi:hypothetical protein